MTCPKRQLCVLIHITDPLLLTNILSPERREKAVMCGLGVCRPSLSLPPRGGTGTTVANKTVGSCSHRTYSLVRKIKPNKQATAKCCECPGGGGSKGYSWRQSRDTQLKAKS